MSRPSTVQALLLLGFREFGIGSMEHGWLFIGMRVVQTSRSDLSVYHRLWYTDGTALL